MTILNVWVEPSRALIGVDTQAITPGPIVGAMNKPTQNISHRSKILTAPYAGTCFAVRGHLMLLHWISFNINLEPLEDFDAIDLAMPRIADKAFDALIKYSGLPANDESMDRQQIALCGWSKRRNQMLAAIHERQSNNSGFVRLEIDSGDWLSAWNIEQGIAPLPNTIGAMFDIAKAQTVYARKKWKELNLAGGRVLVAEVTRHAISTFLLGSLDDEN